MGDLSTLDVSEVFYSLQGEGLFAGYPMVFVRLAGCNLNCEWCDTKYAKQGGQKKLVSQLAQEIIQMFPDTDSGHRVCLTGGEPYLQDFSGLIKILRNNYITHVETNGTIWRPIPVDFITVSPKRGSSIQTQFLQYATEFKFVVKDESDLPPEGFPPRGPISLQPRDNDPASIQFCIDAIKNREGGGAPWRLSLQLHKMLKIQ